MSNLVNRLNRIAAEGRVERGREGNMPSAIYPFLQYVQAANDASYGRAMGYAANDNLYGRDIGYIVANDGRYDGSRNTVTYRTQNQPYQPQSEVRKAKGDIKDGTALKNDYCPEPRSVDSLVSALKIAAHYRERLQPVNDPMYGVPDTDAKKKKHDKSPISPKAKTKKQYVTTYEGDYQSYDSPKEEEEKKDPLPRATTSMDIAAYVLMKALDSRPEILDTVNDKKPIFEALGKVFERVYQPLSYGPRYANSGKFLEKPSKENLPKAGTQNNDK